MSTRALYTFIDPHDGGNYRVYKHHDGYPSGAAEALKATFPLAWELPRFEANEFSAAFVAANKTESGGVRLVSIGEDYGVQYVYVIKQKDGVLTIDAWDADDYDISVGREPFFSGTLDAFIANPPEES